MIKVSKKIEYALLTLSELHKNREKNHSISAREMALRLQLPYDTLAKILKELKEKEWLSSSQGVNGGYLILADLNKLTYLDLLDALGEKIDTLNCQMEEGCHLGESCQISSPLRALDQLLKSFFNQIPLLAFLNPRELNKFLDPHENNHPLLAYQISRPQEIQI